MINSLNAQNDVNANRSTEPPFPIIIAAENTATITHHERIREFKLSMVFRLPSEVETRLNMKPVIDEITRMAIMPPRSHNVVLEILNC